MSTVLEIGFLALAAFAAGALNAGAGGGSFLTYPALIATGVPPVAANATGALSQLPGYLGSAAAYRRDIGPVAGVPTSHAVAAAMGGGLLGAGLLLATPNKVFDQLAPWLILAATLLFLFGRRAAAALAERNVQGRRGMIAGLVAVSVYGGYFSGGYGILLMAHLTLFGARDLNLTNGVKNLASAALTVVAGVAYALGGAVRCPEALVMMAAAGLGGYWGARLIRRAPDPWVRSGVVVVGLSMSALFFWRAWSAGG